MLVEFRIGNFLSFKNITTFSMVASTISEHLENNVFVNNKLNLLKSAVLYGANGSGKSNLLKAMNFIRWFAFNSSKETQATEPIKIEKFKLSTEVDNEPSFFEIVFIHESKKYRYGFEITKDRVHSEWLFSAPSRQESQLFIRDNDKIQVNIKSFKEGKGLEDKTRSNALFLSVVAQFNGEISIKILEWFKTFNMISGLDDMSYMGFTVAQLENDKFKKTFLKYLKIADFGIDDVDIIKTKVNLPELPENLKLALSVKEGKIEQIENIAMLTLHYKYDENKKASIMEKFDLEKEESEGTKKFFGILGPILDTLERGAILVVDELDARFHPSITKFILQLFNSKQTNPKNAQLIFATHDTNLLTNKIFRRDQIWFAEKDQFGITDIYSLVEYKESNKKVRNDASFEKDYIQGKYGAIPFIGNIEILLGGEDE